MPNLMKTSQFIFSWIFSILRLLEVSLGEYVCPCDSPNLSSIFQEIKNSQRIIQESIGQQPYQFLNLGEEGCREACRGQKARWGQAQEASGSCQGVRRGHGLCLPVHQISSGSKTWFANDKKLELIFLYRSPPSLPSAWSWSPGWSSMVSNTR